MFARSSGSTESVATAVISAAVLPEGDDAVMDTFGTSVGRKLAMVRLGTEPTAGSG
jgi:hypothetical protein